RLLGGLPSTPLNVAARLGRMPRNTPEPLKSSSPALVSISPHGQESHPDSPVAKHSTGRDGVGSLAGQEPSCVGRMLPLCLVLEVLAVPGDARPACREPRALASS